MLQKISAQSLATTFITMLLIVTVGYYIFPGYASFFMLVSTIIGAGPFLIIAIVIIICVTISIVKLITKYINRKRV